MRRGMLIALEGIDGAGKTTQISALASLFRAWGRVVVTTKEPTTGRWGQQIRATATTGRLPVEDELALFERDRREHVEQLLRPQLAEGAWVLVDRYYYSTAAYQGIRGLDPADIIARNETFAPRPDLLVVLDLPAEVGVARVRDRDAVENAFERREDLARCREVFRALTGDHVVHVDAQQTVEAVTAVIAQALLAGPVHARIGGRAASLAGRAAPHDEGWCAEVRAELAAARDGRG